MKGLGDTVGNTIIVGILLLAVVSGLIDLNGMFKLTGCVLAEGLGCANRVLDKATYTPERTGAYPWSRNPIDR